MTLAALVLMWFLTAPGEQEKPYSTCPSLSLEEAVRQNVAYSEVSTHMLMKYAKLKVQPKPPASCKCKGKIKVRVMVERDHVVCATAVGGHPLLQEAAVEAAMKWRFQNQKHVSDITGILVFDFRD
jgi:hypothetical protein